VITADDPIIQIALERGLLPRDQFEAALQTMAASSVLDSSGRVDERKTRAVDGLDYDALGRAVAREFGMPYVTLDETAIAPAVLAAVPRSFVLEHQVMPFAHMDGVLRVAIADPIALDVIDALGHVVAGRVQPELAARDAIERAITRDTAEVRARWTRFSRTKSPSGRTPIKTLRTKPRRP
jgi:type IV pilus assembly protein PilB